MSSRSELAVFKKHQGPVQCVQFAPDGKVLATSSSDGTIRLWDPTAGAELTVLQGHTNDVFAIAFAPDGRTLASTGADGTVRIWDLAGPTETAAKKESSP